ncbi:MAG: CinA family protein [Victivallales bacterium]
MARSAENSAAEMLNGVCEKLGSDCGISVTGVAGPGGGTLEKPVGLVYIGVRYLERVQIIENHFRGSREQIRARTAAVALNTLRRFILGLR